MPKECAICKETAVIAAKISKGTQTANVYLCERCLNKVIQTARIEIYGSAIPRYQKGQVFGPQNQNVPLPFRNISNPLPVQSSQKQNVKQSKKSLKYKVGIICIVILVVLGLGKAIAPKQQDNNDRVVENSIRDETDPVEDTRIDVIDVTNKPILAAIDELNEAGFFNILYSVNLNEEEPDKWVVTTQSKKAGEKAYPDDEIILECKKECKLSLEIKSEFNLFFSKYDIEVVFDGVEIGSISNGNTLTKDLEVLSGDHKFVFSKAGDSSLRLEKTITINNDRMFSCQIAHGSDSMDMKNIVESDLLPQDTVPEEAEARIDTISNNVDTVQENIVEADVSEENKPDEIITEEAEQMTEEDYLSLVIPEIEKPEEQKEEKKPKHAASYHSSGDRDIAKEGDSGVFAYKSSGKEYDRYYIIDFDEGYVYSFSYGNGDMYCDRVKIDYGNLNEYIVTTYHDNGYAWSEGLHFKRKNQPDILVLQDRFDFEIEFRTTDLDDALRYRSELEILDY